MEHAIADMERRRYEAMKQADIAVLREVLDDLLVYAHSTRQLMTRNPTWRKWRLDTFAMSPSQSQNKALWCFRTWRFFAAV
jgi:hypothetical protein